MAPANLIWKDILHPGEQMDRHGVKFTITARDTRQGRHNIVKMVRRGLRIPAVWEHQPDANPVFTKSPADRLADYAKHTFGEIRDARIDPAGVLWALHQVDDPKDREQLAKTKYVSPKLFPGYSDSRGGRYEGTTVGHVAATPTPVQFWQRPFELSAGDALYLSYTPEGETAAAAEPSRTEESAVADDKGEKKDEPKKDEPKKGDEKPKAGEDLSGLIKALKAHGLNIPDGVDDLAKLTLVVQANGSAETPAAEPTAEDMDDFDLDKDTPDAQGETTSAGAPPMLMSDGRSPADWAAASRVDCVRRAKLLFASGRTDRQTAQRLKREFDAVELSDPRAAVPAIDKALARLEAYEALPKHAAWSGKARELSATRPAAGKHPLAGEQTDAAAGEAFLAGLKSRLGPAAKK